MPGNAIYNTELDQSKKIQLKIFLRKKDITGKIDPWIR